MYRDTSVFIYIKILHSGRCADMLSISKLSSCLSRQVSQRSHPGLGVKAQRKNLRTSPFSITTVVARPRDSIFCSLPLVWYANFFTMYPTIAMHFHLGGL